MPLQLRLEMPLDNARCVLQIVTPAHAEVPGGLKSGTLIDLETLAEPPGLSWPVVRQGLEDLHAASKRMFFEQILTQDAIGRMGPEY